MVHANLSFVTHIPSGNQQKRYAGLINALRDKNYYKMESVKIVLTSFIQILKIKLSVNLNHVNKFKLLPKKLNVNIVLSFWDPGIINIIADLIHAPTGKSY